MTQVVNDGLGLVHATGQKVRDGVDAVTTGLRNEAGSVANGVRTEIGSLRQHAEHPAAHKRARSARTVRLIGLAGSAAGALMALVVSRLVRAMLRRHGE